MWLRHLSLWVCTFFSFFSFLFFFLGLYIFFLQPSTCPIEFVQTAQLHCFQNQVWPVQSRLKRCDVSPTDEQVYNEMNIIHFFASQHDAKKRPKNDTLIWMRKSIDRLEQKKHPFITWPSGGEPQRWTTWRWQQGERILMHLKHSFIWKNFTEKAVSQIHRRRELEYKQIDSQTNWQILIINLNNL